MPFIVTVSPSGSADVQWNHWRLWTPSQCLPLFQGRVSCRVKGHSEYLLCFGFLPGARTAHLHSISVYLMPWESEICSWSVSRCRPAGCFWKSLLHPWTHKAHSPPLLCSTVAALGWVSAKPESFTELTAFWEKPKYWKISSSPAYLLEGTNMTALFPASCALLQGPFWEGEKGLKW